MDTHIAKEKLMEEFTLLEKELATVGRLDANNKIDWVPKKDEGDTDTADRDAVADSLESLEENTAILTDLENRYNAIKAALIRIEKGIFGTCSVCGNKIEEDRLNANLAATTCKQHM